MATFEFQYEYFFSGCSWSISVDYDLTKEQEESIKIGEWLDDDSSLAKILYEIFKDEKLDGEYTFFEEELDFVDHEGTDKEFADILRRGKSFMNLDEKDQEIVNYWEKDRWSRYLNKKIVRVA